MLREPVYKLFSSVVAASHCVTCLYANPVKRLSCKIPLQHTTTEAQFRGGHFTKPIFNITTSIVTESVCIITTIAQFYKHLCYQRLRREVVASYKASLLLCTGQKWHTQNKMVPVLEP